MCFKDSSYKLHFAYNKQKEWIHTFLGILFGGVIALSGIKEDYFCILVIILIISLIIFIIVVGIYIKLKYYPMEGKITHNYLYKEISNSDETISDIIEFEIPSFVLTTGFKSRVKINIDLYNSAKDKLLKPISKCESKKCLEKECMERTKLSHNYFFMIFF